MSRVALSSLRIRQPKAPLAAVAGIVRLFARRRRERLTLARLDPHLLRDIGLDPGTAAEECAKPFWRG